MARYGLTPEAYRERWYLPQDYPMVAPNYAAARSEMAKKMGLGRKPESRPKSRQQRAGGRGEAAVVRQGRLTL